MIGWIVAWIVAGALLCLGGMYFFCVFPASQVFGTILFAGRTEKKVIALTFDDGPNPPDTSNLLDVLRKHDVRATFFLVGKNLEKFPEVGRAIAADQHAIGNHTYRHNFFTYFSTARLTEEVAHTQQVIQDITGVTPTLFRPPWLFRFPGQLKKISDMGLKPISGVFGSEWELIRPSGQAIARRALQKAKPGAILMFHDGYDAKGGHRQQTVEAIDQLIPQLKAEGYSCVTVPELLQANDK